MLKVKKVLWILIIFILAFTILNPSVFAKGKEGLAHVVEEHTQKIAQLEKAIKNLSGSNEDKEQLTPEVKQALLKEVGNIIKRMDDSNRPDGNAVDVMKYEIEEIEDEKTLKIYTEGSYDWTTVGVYDNPDGAGRSFARGIVFNFDGIAKMYGVDLKYEFYENGERITVFTNLN
ncbi:hypothetical protein [Planococcus sp. S3-L1]|uniref:hypothetical protein n=1 Tax=Planococcus sp. S3-L1 TaxID=3046200 RepID=UPI0024B8A1FB|nr:hypothetical protein [Planococcus sp. S3-L1]MDJ0332284.1 hypothetical protein [Planococcus sp. S3-L1]